jgi:hypothetical protein
MSEMVESALRLLLRSQQKRAGDGRAIVLAVDTNVLVYAADADSPFHGPRRQWQEHQRARPDASQRTVTQTRATRLGGSRYLAYFFTTSHIP